VDVTGTWAVGPVIYTVTQTGDTVVSESSFGRGEGHFTGPNTFVMTFFGNATFTATVQGDTIYWSNNFRWVRQGAAAAPSPQTPRSAGQSGTRHPAPGSLGSSSPAVQSPIAQSPQVQTPPAPSSNQVAPSGGASAAPSTSAVAAATGGSLPALPHRLELLLIRDNPDLLDKAAAEFARWQVYAEQTEWKNVAYQAAGCGQMDRPRCGPNAPPPATTHPRVRVFAFEWQKLIQQRPDLAKGKLLDVFLNPAADWSFVKQESGWDDRLINVVGVFLFAKDQVVDRQVEMVAPQLAPVVKQQLTLAASKAPTNLWFSVPLGACKYDFDKKAIVLCGQNASNVLPANQFRNLPPTARATANYGTVKMPLTVEPDTSIGTMTSHLVLLKWRELLVGGGSSSGLPSINVLALDRPIQAQFISVDAKDAERLKLVHGPGFEGRVYISVDHVELAGSGRYRTGILFGRLQKVDFIAANKEVFATLGLQDLSQGGRPAPRAATSVEDQNAVARAPGNQPVARQRTTMAATPEPAATAPSQEAQDPRLAQLSPEVRQIMLNEATQASRLCQNNELLTAFNGCSCYSRRVLDERLKEGVHSITPSPSSPASTGFTEPLINLASHLNTSECVNPPGILEYGRAHATQFLSRLSKYSTAQRTDIVECVGPTLAKNYAAKPAPVLSLAYVNQLFGSAMASCGGPGGR